MVTRQNVESYLEDTCGALSPSLATLTEPEALMRAIKGNYYTTYATLKLHATYSLTHFSYTRLA